MKLADVLTAVQEPDALAVLDHHWEESLATLGAETPLFLQDEIVREHRAWSGFGPEIEAPLVAMADRIRRDPALLHLAWHCSRLLYLYPDYTEVSHWPKLERALGEEAGAFYVLVVMSMIPRMREVHRELGVDEQISRDTCRQVSGMSGNYRRQTGRLGITLNTIAWLRRFPQGQIFRLNRMEFCRTAPFYHNLAVYRNRTTREVLALAPDGMRYDAEGQAVRLEEEGWTATRRETEEEVVGYPISPEGMAVAREVRLPTAEWECVLTKGDGVLAMHIPPGGGMEPERGCDSMRRAAAFFRRHFPDEPVRAITSVSWIFNTQLEQIQFSSDNMARFQRELYLFPVLSAPHDGLWFVFLRDDLDDPATLPRDTSLRRAVADWLIAGHRWRCGGMFYLLDDIDHVGEQHYRSHFPPKGLGLGG